MVDIICPECDGRDIEITMLVIPREYRCFSCGYKWTPGSLTILRGGGNVTPVATPIPPGIVNYPDISTYDESEHHGSDDQFDTRSEKEGR